ncbi:MAG: phosphatase [Rhizobiales bacterium]|nr:phosphatase [Hyphomicrobiales bacterium]OJY07404.1 MAG: hypothetical protein BGP07_05810 [Rhizobiales bacterium 63-22]
MAVSDVSRIIDELAAFAVLLADESRRIRGASEAEAIATEKKPDRSLVTDMDRRIEAELRRMIQHRYPGHGILGEEFPWVNVDAEWVWVLDPIDGTAAFIAGMPVHSTLIALAHRGEPVVGIVDVPAIDSRWVGVRGRATEKNGVPCRFNPAPEAFSDAIMSTSNPEFYAGQESAALAVLCEETAWRIYGGAALSYGLLADGRIHLALDAGLNIYDYAPFRPVIEGVGGVITDWDGNPVTLASGTRVLAACDPSLHGRALEKIKGWETAQRC